MFSAKDDSFHVHAWRARLATTCLTFGLASGAAAIEYACPEASLRAPSAAQNETVIQTCMQCGAINGAEARTCCLCDTRLSRNPDATFVSAPTPLRNEGNLAVEPDWRSQVSQKLEAYHLRRGRPHVNRIQSELTFEPSTPREPAEVCAEVHSFEAPPATITKRRFRPARVERLEINVEQPAFDFITDGGHAGPKTSVSAYDSPVPSVASLVERRRAAALDVAFILFAYGGFLMLFGALGGRFSLSRFDAVVTLATLGLLYAQYVTLFTYFAGATPGMMLRHLRVVSLDGLDPSPRQLLWRSLGYLISAGTMMLGFLWALWDEDQLSWHDRISQTCVTTDVVPAGEPCSQPSASR